MQLQGEWKRGCSAGGSRNNLEMFAKNPQFLLTVGPLSQFHPNTPEGKELMNIKRLVTSVFRNITQNLCV